ncbi:juvenile hormone acid O-methyltransferase-like isoform X1 [Athalia rosae]|uniref:juvenile hormone acid O-methyltransferase-like isoform X1 n=1 Tax=Athalia rosae TaxID=37344 RepID=UPI00203476C0|nr:juvenile hormone acid O-methyltransferase-like isoform X1 [Athalia rosae]
MHQPEIYTTANNLQRQDAADVIEEFEDDLAEISSRCLDAGTGPGDVVVDFLLPKLNPTATVVCSDISEPMVNFGKERYKDNSRLSFLKLDIETPNLPSTLVGQFDHVTSFYCINWCQDIRQVFGNIFDLLRPGGTTILSFLANNPSLDSYPILAAMPRYQPYMKDFRRYLPVFQGNYCNGRRTLKNLVNYIGFEVGHCSLRERSHVFHSKDNLKNFLVAVNPFVDRMPVELREEYKDDLTEIVAKQFIIFKNNINNNNDDDFSTLTRYHIFVLRLKKNLST